MTIPARLNLRTSPKAPVPDDARNPARTHAANRRQRCHAPGMTPSVPDAERCQPGDRSLTANDAPDAYANAENWWQER